MSRLSEELLKRLDKDVSTIVGQTSDALVKLLERDRDVLAKDIDVAKVRQAAEHQVKFHLEALFQAFESIFASEGHAQESLDTREAIQEAVSNKLTYLYGFDETYLIGDKKFSSQYLGGVEEKSFKEGLSLQDRERQLELHRWLKEIIEKD